MEDGKARASSGSGAQTTIRRRATGEASESEPPEPETVATEIGPLPADLWQLLGQTPPSPPTSRPKAAETTPPANVQARASDTAKVAEQIVPADPPDATVQRASSIFRAPSASDEQERTPGALEPARSMSPAKFAAALDAAERPGPAEAEATLDAAGQVASGANMAMRLSAEPAAEEVEATAPTSRLGSAEEQDEEQDESELSKSDLDNLARLVYQELKRRLSLEKERGRGRF